MPPHRLTPRAPGPRRGFTLAETLITLAVLGLVGLTVTRLMTNQARFWTRTREAGGVQRNLRTGLSLLPQDLRAASRFFGDLTELTDSSIQVRATIGTSILCTRIDNRTIDLPPRGLANNALTSWHTQPAAGDVAWIYDENTAPSTASWIAYNIVSITPVATTNCTAAAGSPFTDAALDPPATKPRWRVVLDRDLPPPLVLPNGSTANGVGSPMRFTRPVRYSLYQPAGSAQWYLGYREQVGGAFTAPMPVAGPFQAYAAGATGQSGVRFRYFDSTQTELAIPAAGTRVARVDLVMRASTQLRGGTAPEVTRDSVAVRVSLRNRW